MIMKPSEIRKILLIVILMGAFAIAKGHSGIDTLLETGFLIIGANGIEYKKILKVYFDC